MAYESVNVSKLRSSLNKIDDIKSSNFSDVINSIDASKWSGGIVNRIKTALKKDVSEIKEIQKKINNYKTACNYIEEYKDLDDNNKLNSYKTNLSNYNKKLNSYRNEMKSYTSDDSSLSRTTTQSKIDYYSDKAYSMNTNISSMNTKIENARSRQKLLINKINNLVN